jgi:hypothetical protein
MNNHIIPMMDTKLPGVIETLCKKGEIIMKVYYVAEYCGITNSFETRLFFNKNEMIKDIKVTAESYASDGFEGLTNEDLEQGKWDNNNRGAVLHWGEREVK